MKSATLERLLRDRSEKSSVVLATNLSTGDERLVYPSDLEGENGLDPAIAQAVQRSVPQRPQQDDRDRGRTRFPCTSSIRRCV